MHKNNKERINKKKNSKRPPQGRIQPEGFPVVRPDVAGIDLGSEGHWVCAPTVDGAALEVQEFGATTPELERMAAWLRERKVVSVAIESTGVYFAIGINAARGPVGVAIGGPFRLHYLTGYGGAS